MRLPQGILPVLFVGSFLAATTALGQAPAPTQSADQPAPPPAVQPTPSTQTAQPVGFNSAPERPTYTVPAGTKVLLQLNSSINSKSAKPGDGVYLTSIFPVVVGNRVMIPNGVYVQGVIDRVVRGGRVKGKSQLDMHFTSMIFPNGSVVEIPGMVNSIPGAKDQSVKDDGEGTIEQDGGKGRNAGEAAKIAIPTGAGVGTIGGASTGHPIEGGLAGLGAGLATVGIVSLFTRNADVEIPSGTQVEMLLQQPLKLQESNVAGGAGTSSTLVPAANQARPLPKPAPEQMVCSTGSFGCQ
jgi:type IV secretion system protein VirB10